MMTLIICSPPPVPEPDYQVIVNESPLVQESQPPSPLKNLDENTPEPSQFVESVEAVITFEDEGKIEEHKLKVTSINLTGGRYYTSYSFSFTLPDGQSLEVLSNTCNKVSTKDPEDVECTPSNEKAGNKYSFKYNYKLFNGEYIEIIYKYKIVKPREILYRQEAFAISAYKQGVSCSFKYIIPDGFTSLGLKENLLTRDSDNVYSYNECLSESKSDVIRFTPKESNWKANVGIYVKSQSDISKNVSVIFPRYYKGGKNTNKYYKLVTNEDEFLEESNLIEDEINLKVDLEGKNQRLLGVEVNTAFTNKLSNSFSVYASEQLYQLNDTIDEEIKNKAEEIKNDGNSEPLYKKIGKFVYKHITYDLAYHGKDITAFQIYKGKRGVCEHYTILYNAMLNAVGIKTLKIFGWAFQKEEVSANEKTIGHAWTAALVGNKWIELDATWGLFDGIPSGHIMKGYGKEIIYMSSSSVGKVEFIKTHDISLIDNLNDEKGDDIIFLGLPEGIGESIENKENKSNHIKLPKFLLYFISVLYLLL
jgi:hypothetical protein